jgi:uncharacterized protein (TIGR03437 family)
VSLSCFIQRSLLLLLTVPFCQAQAPGLYSSASALYFSSSVAHPTAVSQSVTIGSLGAPIGFNVTVATQTGNGWMTASLATGTTPQSFSVNTNGLSGQGTYRGTITITPTSPAYSAIVISVTFIINATEPPQPFLTDVQNGASFLSGYAPNAIWTIKGTGLASITDTWNSSVVNGVLPTSLDGVTVTFNGYPAYISYISQNQINVVTPDAGTSQASVAVNNNGAVSGLFNAQGNGTALSPSFFLWPGSQAVATRQDYSYAVKPGTFANATTLAAKPGDIVILWGTGFGPTTPHTQPGAITPNDQLYSVSTLPSVTINGVAATVYGAALAPGYSGLFQVAIQVPPGLGNGDWPIVASVGTSFPAVSPNGVLLAVHN